MRPLLTLVAVLLSIQLALLLVRLYILLPLKMRRTLTISADPQFVPTRAESLDPEAARNIGQLVHDLLRENFTVVANVATDPGGLVSTAGGVTVYLVNRTTGDVALGVWATALHQRNWAVSFRTFFEDGTEIATASSAALVNHPRRPGIDAVNADWITDPRLLYAIHRARVERSPRAHLPRRLPEPGNELAFFRGDQSENLRWVQVRGYYRLDPQTDRYRLTLKGAFLLTARQIWPLRNWRLRNRALHARRTLRQLGFLEAATMTGRPAPRTTDH